MNTLNREIEILESIYRNPHKTSQRNLANLANLSLGMTNAVLKKLADKGWLTIEKKNNRNIRYAVTPKGREVITRESYHYFKETIKEVVYYRKSLEALMVRMKNRGYMGVLLVGQSDLDFMVEYFCTQNGLKLLKKDPCMGEKVFFLYCEGYLPDEEEKASREDVMFLQDLLMQG